MSMDEKPKPDTREEVIEAILALVDDGKSLRQACKEIDFPRKTFEGWVDADEKLAAQYERARANRADKLFEEILFIADTPQIGTVETVKEWGVEVQTKDMIDHRRLQIDSRRWMLGKMAPKRYGDRVELEHSGEVKTNHDFDLSKLSHEELTALRDIQSKAASDAPAVD